MLASYFSLCNFFVILCLNMTLKICLFFLGGLLGSDELSKIIFALFDTPLEILLAVFKSFDFVSADGLLIS